MNRLSNMFERISQLNALKSIDNMEIVQTYLVPQDFSSVVEAISTDTVEN